MGGTISVKSKLGDGSEFTVVLDLETLDHETHDALAPEDEITDDLAGHKVLIVEDNDSNAESAVMILSQHHISADRAVNGEEGLQMVKDAGEGFYSAVLMDIQMPVMNGYEATKAIRSLDGTYYKNLPIIAMSANAYDEDVRNCLDAGMNAHLAKPFQPDDLFNALRAHALKD